VASSSASGSGSGQGAGDEEDGGGEGGRRNAEEWRIVGRCVGAVGAMAVGRHAGVLGGVKLKLGPRGRWSHAACWRDALVAGLA